MPAEETIRAEPGSFYAQPELPATRFRASIAGQLAPRNPKCQLAPLESTRTRLQGNVHHSRMPLAARGNPVRLMPAIMVQSTYWRPAPDRLSGMRESSSRSFRLARALRTSPHARTSLTSQPRLTLECVQARYGIVFLGYDAATAALVDATAKPGHHASGLSPTVKPSASGSRFAPRLRCSCRTAPKGRVPLDSRRLPNYGGRGDARPQAIMPLADTSGPGRPSSQTRAHRCVHRHTVVSPVFPAVLYAEVAGLLARISALTLPCPQSCTPLHACPNPRPPPSGQAHAPLRPSGKPETATHCPIE